MAQCEHDLTPTEKQVSLNQYVDRTCKNCGKVFRTVTVGTPSNYTPNYPPNHKKKGVKR